jgi:hypothetical protein
MSPQKSKIGRYQVAWVLDNANDGVVDIVETPQLNLYEQARAQCIAKLQVQLTPLER